MNKYQTLQIAEYLSIVAAIAGSFIAVVNGVIIYATVPMALAILLNLVNRSQFEQQFKQHFKILTADQHQEILNEIRSLQTEILNLSVTNKLDETQEEFEALSEKKIIPEEVQANQLIEESIYQLQTQYQNLQNTLDSLVYRMLSDGVLSSYNPKPSEQGIANLITQYKQEKAS